MGQPVICPHCGKFLVSENEPGNPFCLCPHCGRWMNISRRARRRKTKSGQPIKCPFCNADMPVGGDTCLTCKRQIITGEKLPLLRQLALVPTSKKMTVLSGALAGLVVLVVLVNLVVSWWSRPARRERGPVPIAPPPEVISARQTLAKLVGSTEQAEQARLGNRLGKVGPAAVGLILQALDERDLDDGARRALIAALGRIGDPKAADAVARAMNDPRLRQTATISLALLGDRRAARPMLEHFTEHVRRAALAQALAKRSLLRPGPHLAAARRQWSERLAGLRRPVAALGPSALPGLLAGYWPAWQWPMRDRGRHWLGQVDQIVSAMRLEDTIADVLEGLLTGQPADVRLAAAMVLKRRRAGGRRAAEQWAAQIADLLADSRLDVRQRAVWTIAAIADKAFARFGPDQLPTQAPAAALTEASHWVQRRTGRRVTIDPTLLDPHRTGATVTRRVYYPARAHARRLLAGLPQADWPTARRRWRALASLPPDAAPAVRSLLEGDVRQLKVPARLVVLLLLAQWRDRAAVRPMGRLTALLDNPPWMPACLAVAQTSAARDGQTQRWLDRVAKLDPALVPGRDPEQGLVAADLGRLIGPQGRPALAAMHGDPRYHNGSSLQREVHRAAVDAMIAYGWPVAAWLKELPGR